jgi:hypothetical protein
MAPKVPTPAESAIYVCLQGYVTAQGVFKTGERLRGSHPGVQASPAFWAAEGLDDEQTRALRVERFGPSAAAIK